MVRSPDLSNSLPSEARSPAPAPKAATPTVKLFHSAGRHFVNIYPRQARSEQKHPLFVHFFFFKLKLRSCGGKKERSVVRVSGKSEVNLQGESDSMAETLNIKWAIGFGQLAGCTSGVQAKPEAGEGEV